MPGGQGAAASPIPHNSTAEAADGHTSAINILLEHSETTHSALSGSSRAHRLQHPIHKATLAAHQHDDGSSSMPSSDQHTTRGAQAFSPTSAAPKEESWQEVRSGRRQRAAKLTASKAGKGGSGSQTLPETLPKPRGVAQMSPQRAQRLRAPLGFAPPGFTAGPKLPKPGPPQADVGSAHLRPALRASVQRQPAQASAAMQHWPPLPASARLEAEHIPAVPEAPAVRAPQQNLDQEGLLKDLPLQLRAGSTTFKQHTVHNLQNAFPIICQCISSKRMQGPQCAC